MRRKFLILFIVVVGVLALGGGAFALNGYFGGGAGSEAFDASTLTRGLVGYWDFEDGSGTNANDSSDQNNDGTLTTMDPNTDWIAGKAGNGGALDFDGSSDYVDIGNVGGTVQTIAFWMNADDNTSRSVIDIDGTDYIELDSSGNVLATSFPAATVYVDAVVASATTQSTWHFIAITDSTGVSPTDMDIGAQDIGGSPTYFDGKLDEVRIYNRALSAAEVNMLYSRGGPVAHWRFDEGSGTTAFDSVGSNDGTLTNMEDADWKTGQFGTALDFDKADEYISIGNIMQGVVPLTISGWVNGRSFTETTANINTIISKERDSSDAWVLRVGDSGIDQNKIQWVIVQSDSTEIKLNGALLETNQWYHVVVTYDTTGRQAIYINGLLDVEQTTADGTIFNGTAEVEIGRSEKSNDRLWDGLIDDVRIYNYVRSAEEIKTDYNAGFAARFGGSPADWVTQGLVGYWDFEDGAGTNANDASDSNRDGTLTSMDPNTDWIAGKAGNGGALDFDGSNDHVLAGDVAEFEFSGDFTLSSWIKHDESSEAGSGDGWRVVSRQDDSNDLYFLRVNDTTGGTNGAVAFTIRDESGGTVYTASSTTTVKDGNWHHIVGVRTGSTLRLYINGVEEDSISATAGALTNFSSGGFPQLAIGTYHSTSELFSGIIDEVRIYNRALSAAEVRYLYNQGDPIGHWKFDEGTGTTAFDSAGSNDGTASSTVVWTQGQFGTALDFERSNSEFVSIADTAELSSLDNFTVSAWIKMESINGSDQMTIVSHWSTTANDREFALEIHTSGAFRYVDNNETITGSVLEAGRWYHVAATYDLSTYKIYVDGVLDRTVVSSRSSANADEPISIGAREKSNGNDQFFDGLIDDVRIYNYVRSAEEIKADYNAGLGTKFGGSPADWINQGLVGYWDFEEGNGTAANDSSDENNDGTLTNMESTDWAISKAGFGTAIDVDGADDEHVNVGTGSALQITGAITVAAWLNLDADPGGGEEEEIVSKRRNSSHRGWSLMVADDSPQARFQIADTQTSDQIVSGGPVLSTGTWYHLVGVYKPSDALEVYVDGVLVAENTTSIAASQYNNASRIVAIGNKAQSQSGNAAPDGQIDEVRIYNRALSASEIRYLYNQGDPIVHWKFEEGSGTTAFDSEGSSDGTLTNMDAATDWTQGKFGTALEFDGTDEYVTVGDVGDDNANMTISAWVYADAFPNIWNTIIGKETGSGTDQTFVLRVDDSPAGQIGWSIWQSNDTAIAMSSNTNINTARWYHIAATYSSSGTQNIYIDGVLDATQSTANGTLQSNNVATTISRSCNCGTTRNWDGKLDDVKIYNYVRTAEEIKADYNAGLSTHFR